MELNIENKGHLVRELLMWIMSDRTLPRSLRMSEGFGVHSFRLINDAGEFPFDHLDATKLIPKNWRL